MKVKEMTLDELTCYVKCLRPNCDNCRCDDPDDRKYKKHCEECYIDYFFWEHKKLHAIDE